jgi:PTS system nitrogen regulatory IIA component
MDIADFLAPDDVLADLRAHDKLRLLHELSARAGTALKLKADIIEAELFKREQLGSTGMGDGVAIPHARFPTVHKPYGLMARLKKPIDFEAIDGLPVDLVFLLLLPSGASGEPLNALACVARKLREPEVLDALRSGADGKALFRAMTEQQDRPSRAKASPD